MAATFGDVIREVQLLAASVPSPVVRQWAFDVYATLLSGSRWGWQRAVTRVTLAPARAVTATFTQGSDTVTSAAAFLATDVGKQILVGTDALLTVEHWVDASTVQLRAPYSGSSGAVAVQVIEAFYVPPAGFQQLVLVTDLTRQVPVPHWLTLEQIMLWDPARTQLGTPRGLIPHTPQRVAGGTDVRVWHEWWPRNTAGGTFEVAYLAGPQTSSLTDETPLPGVLADRAYVLKEGVLAKCAAYPGTAAAKNPYFNLSLAQHHGTLFAVGRKDLGIVDEDHSGPVTIDTIDWQYVRLGQRTDAAYQYSDQSVNAGGWSGSGYPY